MADPTEAAETESEEGTKRNWRRDLEDRATQAETRAKEAEDRLAGMERKLALSDAGLSSLNEKQVKALLAAHDGEISAELLKATATELGFSGAPATTEESTSEAGALETLDPNIASEAQELASLSGSPAVHASSKNVIRTQEAFDAKVRSFDNEADLDAFLRENVHLLPHGRTTPL